jgi:hypothetical protein
LPENDWAPLDIDPHTAGGAPRGCAALVLLGLLAPVLAGAAPDSLAVPRGSHALDGRYVRHVRLETHSIFEPLPVHGRRLYQLANRLHIETRARTIRSTFVFHEGGRWSEEQRAETERHLRDLAFLVPDSVVALPVGSDSVDVRVITHDNWTTSPEFSLESGGGQRFASASLEERNLFGLGTALSLSYHEDVGGISRQARLEDGELFGTHWRGRLSAGINQGGTSRGALLMLPFWAEDAKVSATANWAHDSYDAQLYSQGNLASTVHVHNEALDLLYGIGGKRLSGTIVRAVAGYEERDRTYSRFRIEPGAPAAFLRSPEELDIHRVATEVIVAKPRFIVVRGVEQMDRDEDVDLGPGGSIKTGYAPEAFGSSANEGYLRVRGHAGCDAGRFGFGTIAGGTEARLRPRISEHYTEFSAHWVQQPHRDVAAVAGLMGISGYDMEPDFQVTLGGVNGLRAFPVHEVTGTQAWRANAELRWTAVHDVLHLASFGAAGFWDAGRAWGPGSQADGWHHDAGFGLRISMPHSALAAVARFDIAWPLGPANERGGPVYSFGSGQAF